MVDHCWAYGRGVEQRVSIVTLGVKDITRSRRFYEELGWSGGQEVEETVFFQAGGQAIVLWGRQPHRPTARRTFRRVVPVLAETPVSRYYCKVMAKEKVTLTLDAGQLAELRDIAGARSLSAAVDSAVGAHLIKLRHLAAVDDWSAELEREHGPVATETLEWAAQIVDKWDAGRSPAPESRRAG